MPLLFFKSVSLVIGQLIKPAIFFSIISLFAISKHLKIYLFDFFDNLSKGFFCKYLTLSTGKSFFFNFLKSVVL